MKEEYNFAVKVEIMYNETGEVRSQEEKYADRGHAEFMYEDGNYACDCNRGLFFARWGGDEDPDVGCDGELYSARLTDISAGEIFYADGRFV